MIFVDSRAGSQDLIKPLQSMGLPVEGTRLDYADLMFEGRGIGGVPVMIGIEYKQLRELVAALRSGRLQGYQMLGMREMFEHSYLLIEGELLFDTGNRLLRRKGRTTVPLEGHMGVQELLGRKHGLHICGGLNPIVAQARADTLQEIAALYRFWTDKDQDQHKSHIAIYVAPPLVPISDFRATLTTFPGVGLHTSRSVERAFGSLQEAVLAPVERWADITTTDDHGKSRRLGTKTAERIVAFCRKSTS